MDKVEEINSRVFVLKKRLREPDMVEVFGAKNKSIVEIIDRANKLKSINMNGSNSNSNNSRNNISFFVKDDEKSMKHSKLLTLVEEKINNSSMPYLQQTMSNSSNSSKKSSGKSEKKNGKPLVPKLKPMPEKNLLTIDQWPNKNSNHNTINNTLNTVKKELIAITQQNTGLSNTQFAETKTNKVEIDLKGSQQPAEPLTYDKEEGRITVDDSFYDQKDDLFEYNLPPEVMGGTPEFIEEKYIENTQPSQPEKETEVIQVKTNQKQEIPIPPVISTRITIPNTFNNEALINISKQTKKNPKIIDDEDEEIDNTSMIYKTNPRDTPDSNLTCNKIKIPIDLKDLKDFKSPMFSESNRSVKSIEVNEEKAKNYDVVVIDKKNLKNISHIFKKKEPEQVEQSVKERVSSDLDKTKLLKEKIRLGNKVTQPPTNAHINPNSTKSQNPKPKITGSTLSIIDSFVQGDEKIEKKEESTYLILTITDSVNKLYQKLLDSLENNQSAAYHVKNEFDSVNPLIISLKQDSNATFSKSIVEKIAKIIIKILDVLTKDEKIERFSYDVISILESANTFLKKNAKHINTNFLKSVKIVFKFLLNLLKLKNYKNKLSQLIIDGENFVKDKKQDNKNSVVNLIKFCKVNSSYNKSVDNLKKLLFDIKEEEEIRSRTKKNKNSDFTKVSEKMKKYYSTNPNFLHYSKIYKIARCFYDLILSYFNED